jgi:hypothetical protein
MTKDHDDDDDDDDVVVVGFVPVVVLVDRPLTGQWTAAFECSRTPP